MVKGDGLGNASQVLAGEHEAFAKHELMAQKMCFISDIMFRIVARVGKIPQMIYRLKLVFVCFGTVCCVLYAGWKYECFTSNLRRINM